MYRILLSITFLSYSLITVAQKSLVQNIKGQVTERSTGLPLVGANVYILDSDPLIGTSTDIDGYYVIENMPVGRYSLGCSYIGYNNTITQSTLLTSGKELVYDFSLEEKLLDIEVEITGVTEQNAQKSELGTVSIQSFDSELTSRYAGSRNDVARMAAGFAGVSANDDSRNDIVIRGNSPSGLLWRMNDIDIPNPSHFGALGATGGPVSMLNNNLLTNSTFMTSAFPALYGNALSGVFDLTVRKGNKDKMEGLFAVAFNGFEGGLEGPLGKKGGSYLVNYRYSVIDLISRLGGSTGGGTGTGDAIPRYQDLSFHINLPTSKIGTFSLIGLRGNSSIEFLSDIESSDNPNLFSDSNEDLYYKSNMQVYGISNKHYYNNHSYGKLIISYSESGVNTDIDTIGNNLIVTPVYRDNSSQERLSVAYRYMNKLNRRNTINSGVTINRLNFNFLDSVRRSDNNFDILRDYNGSSNLIQAYTQWQYRPHGKWIINTGIYGQSFSFNNTSSIEPRLNVKYEFSPKLSTSMGLGRHSKLQDYQLYLINTVLPNGEYIQTNNDLGMTKSDQAVVGLNYQLSEKWNIKSELYYQRLSDIPVERDPSNFSAINLGADFNIPSQDSLINEGTGTNVGIELTLERSFQSGFYLLSTMSLYESKYKGSDGISRNTAFDSRYVANVLSGKEFELSQKYSFSIDTKITFAGGKRYTPIDLDASILEGEAVFIKTSAFAEQFDDYFRSDLKFTFRENKKKYSQLLSFDLQNIFNTDNVFGQSYDNRNREIEINNQLGFYVVIDYRLMF